MAKKITIPIELPADVKGAIAAAKAIEALTRAEAGAAKASATLAQASARSAAANNQAAVSAQRLAQAENQTAASAARAAQAQQRIAQEAVKTQSAMDRAAISALRLQQAQERASKPPAKGLGTYFSDFKADAMSAAGGAIAFTAALGAAQSVAQSFQDAFNFKASLDATTLAVNAQLKGVRDSGQVWNEAAGFAQKYKLTQQETTQAISASLGVMRSSKASVEDILGVLARMQVLSPEQSLEEAAIAVKALASGDTTSLVTRFEVGRDVATQMKEEIQGGADAVQVLSKFLDNTGIGMDVLAAKTEGAAGKIRDAAIAQEELALAQARFAEGPGLAILDAQIAATQGLTEGFGNLQAGISLFTDENTNLNTSISATAGTLQQLAIGLGGNAMAAQASGDAVQSQASQFLNWIGISDQATGAAQTNANAQQQQAAATINASAAYVGYVTAAHDATTATLAAQAAEQAEAQTKQLNAVETQILSVENERLAAQAQLTASNIIAAGGNIQAQAAALAASSSFIDQLTAAYIRLAVAQQTAGQKRIASQEANTISYGRAVGGAPGRTGSSDVDAVVRLQKANTDAANARIDQERAIASAKGDTAAQIRIEQAELAKLVPGTAPYIDQQTKILQLQSQRAGGAAKAGAAAVSAEQKTSSAIVTIAQDTAEKLQAIDARVADERMRNAEKLAQSLRETALDMVASQEADDLDLVGADPERIDELADREAAQAKARLSQIEAVKEAQRVAETEGADVAQATFDARQEQIQKQQELDEKYYAKQRELAGDPALLDQLETQYKEGSDALAAAAANDIAVAQATAAAKAQAIEAEKAAVLGAAAEQAAALGNTGKAAGSAQSRVDDLARALASLPKNVSTTIQINEVKTGSSSGSSTGASSSAGSGSSTPAPSAPPKASANRVGAASSGRVSAQGVVEDAANAAIGTLQGGTTPPIASTSPGKSSGGGGGGGSAGASDPADQLKAIEQAISVLEKVAELRQKLAEVGPPLDMALVNTLSQEAFDAAQALGARFVQLSKEQGESFEIFTGALENAISVLSDAAALRGDLLDIGPPINQETVNALAAEAFAASQALGALFVLLTEEQGENFEIFTDALSNAMGALSDAASLRKDLLDIGPPLDTFTVMGLAKDAQLALQLTQAQLIPLSEEQADALKRFTSAESDAIGVLSDAAALRADLAEPYPPISAEYLQSLAQTAAQATAVVQATLLPTTEEQADALSRYADAAGSSVSALSAVAGLTQDLFNNYQSPTDAQIQLLANDAMRITDAFTSAARTIEQSDGAKAWAEAVGATFQAASAGLETIDRINLTQVAVDPAQLAVFQASSLAIMDTAQVLGARAAQIPAADIGAWQNVTAALNSQSEMLINMAAVPFGNLGQIAGGFAGQSGGGGSPVTVINNIYQLPGESMDQLANKVGHRTGQKVGMRK